jgi:sulfite reductase (NADPH) flavoprotein alpha-component
VLALGDRSYGHFCGFGHQLDQWLRQHGAHPLFDAIEVDNADPAAAPLAAVAGTTWRRRH